MTLLRGMASIVSKPGKNTTVRLAFAAVAVVCPATAGKADAGIMSTAAALQRARRLRRGFRHHSSPSKSTSDNITKKAAGSDSSCFFRLA